MTTYTLYVNETNDLVCDQACNDINCKKITLTTNDDCEMTSRTFHNDYNSANDGEQCIVEYSDTATDTEGKEYTVYWRFDVTKGDMPEDDCLPWDDETNIYSVVENI